VRASYLDASKAVESLKKPIEKGWGAILRAHLPPRWCRRVTFNSALLNSDLEPFPCSTGLIRIREDLSIGTGSCHVGKRSQQMPPPLAAPLLLRRCCCAAVATRAGSGGRSSSFSSSSSGLLPARAGACLQQQRLILRRRHGSWWASTLGSGGGGARPSSSAAASPAAAPGAPTGNADAAAAPGWAPPPPSAAYIHLPFCKRKCFYCDFPVEAVGASPGKDREFGLGFELRPARPVAICMRAVASVSSQPLLLPVDTRS
jgi:hypothetical protein